MTVGTGAVSTGETRCEERWVLAELAGLANLAAAAASQGGSEWLKSVTEEPSRRTREVQNDSSVSSVVSFHCPRAQLVLSFRCWLDIIGCFFFSHRQSRPALLSKKSRQWFLSTDWLDGCFSAGQNGSVKNQLISQLCCLHGYPEGSECRTLKSLDFPCVQILYCCFLFLFNGVLFCCCFFCNLFTTFFCSTMWFQRFSLYSNKSN